MVQVREHGSNGFYLVLLDLKYTLANYHWHSNQLAGFQVRPHADDFIRFLLQQQDYGRCQLGFYTTLSRGNAFWTVLQLLELTTGTHWIQQGPMLEQVGAKRRVWLFDRSCGEPHPSCCHAISQTHIVMKNLDLALSTVETSGRKFHRTSLVHMTCTGVEAGKHVDEASAKNLLLVRVWCGRDADCELQVAQASPLSTVPFGVCACSS